MSQFFKNFLTEGEGIPDAGRFLALGAFGKHPGWDDHVEDLGLETETLALAKRILYVQGVGGQIDTGAWEKLEPARRAEGFNHIFVWQRSRQLLLGRMWSSSDGKGRTRYPMVICAQCGNTSLAWALQQVLPRLESIEQACKAASTAQEVRSILDRARTELRAGLGNPAAGDDYAPASAEALRNFVADPALGPEHQGWFRLLYQIRNQMAAYSLGSFNAKTVVTALRPQQLRVPLASATPEQSIVLWSRFFASRIEGQVPMFFAVPVTGGWLDVVLGEPATQEFFCLRALAAALPLVTEVPYGIDESFKAQARRALEDFQAGKAASPSAASAAEESSPSGWASITQRWFRSKGTKLLLLGGLVLGAASAAVLLSAHSRGNRQVAQSSAREQLAAPAPPQPQPVLAKAEIPAVPKALMLAAAPVSQSQGAVEAAQSPAPAPGSSPAAAPKSEVPRAPPLEPVLTPTGRPLAPPAAASPSALTSPSNLPPASFTNSIGMVLVRLSALPGTDGGAWVGQFEVTQREFQQVMGSNPSQFQDPLRPVETVSWQGALEFCLKLTAREKQAGALPAGCVYTLPTQAQWEAFLGDAGFENAVTSRDHHLRSSTVPVGSLAPNAFGLYDVLGNVWEWCGDAPAGPERYLKGGAFSSGNFENFRPLDAKTARRSPAGAASSDAGFRCLLARSAVKTPEL
jgi:hypothetical protein